MLADQIKARPHVSHWMVMGGGSLLDLAGFVLGQTGIECSHIPTTLLAAVDAGLGGKTGVDYASFKNQIGGFYFPKQTVICKDFFSSLTIEMKASGLAEAMKHALLSADISLFQRLCQSDLASPEFITEEDLQAALLVKQAYVLLDPYEIKGLRTHLNFGHTYAHMIEALSLNTVPHGICVLWGLKVALELSIGEGHLEKNCGKSLLVDLQASTSWRILETYMQEFKTTLMELTEVQLSEKVSSILVQDKKKGEQSLLTEVLLKKGHDEEHPKPFTVQLKLPQLAAFFITQLQEFTNGRT
jgi:3-dehydroquinate synthase